MKKGILIIALLFVISIGCVSATDVRGKIYDENSNLVVGAKVVASCFHDGDVNYKTTYSSSGGDSDGGYWIYFSNDKCDIGDEIIVVATHGDLSGTDSGISVLGLVINVVMENQPAVPEFGFYFGLITLVCAVGVFFVVKK